MRMKKGLYNKRSQVTIFVILAIMIVAVAGILLFPRILRGFAPSTPVDLIPKECVETNARQALEQVMLHGGELNPELYFNYNAERINYLCYTTEWYQTCVMQEPFLKQKIEAEASAAANKAIEKCVKDMEDELKSQGYSLKISGKETGEISIVKDNVLIGFDLTLAIEKGDYKQTFNSNDFKTDFSSKYYDLTMIASSIQNFEARYGDSNTDTYMSFYPNIKVEKIKKDDGTKIYILTERNTGEKMQFATRSLSWPPGYGV